MRVAGNLGDWRKDMGDGEGRGRGKTWKVVAMGEEIRVLWFRGCGFAGWCRRAVWDVVHQLC